MKKHFYILASILLSLLSFQSKASHMVGSDIGYQCTNTPNIYKVTLKIYRDCAGISVCPGCTNAIPNGTVAGCTISNSGWSTQIIGASSGCLGTNFGAFTLNAVTVSSGFDIIQTCNSIITVCTNCNTRNAGTYSPGIEVYTYEGNVDLSAVPSSCCRITLAASSCCRNLALTTIVSGGSYQTLCEIDRCQTACNSAPIYTNDAAVLVCAGVDFVYNLGATDPDGDFLEYTFGTSLQGIGTPVSYIAPYTAAYPFPYFGAPNANGNFPAGLHIDPLTGNVIFRPIGIFVSNLVIEVTQWRWIGSNRVNVGMTRRDVQFQTVLCNTNKPPIIKTYKNNVLQSGTAGYTATAGVQMCLDFVAEDQSQVSPIIVADTSDIKWNNPGLYLPIMANATFTRNYILSQRGINGPKADSFKFCWTPPNGAIRDEPYLFTITGSDRFCPIKGFAIRGITIKVESAKSLTIDSTTKNSFCSNRINTTNVNYRTNKISLLSGNVFTVQLSDSSGSFNSGTSIGTKTSVDTIGFIPISFPNNLFANSNYKIRLICNSDTTKGEPYNINFLVSPTIGTITGNAAPTSIISPYAYSVSSQANTTYNWSATNGTIQSGQGTNAINIIWPTIGNGSLKAKITNSNSCTDSTSLLVNITSVGINNLSLDNDLKVFPNPTKTSIIISNKTNLVGKKYIITNLVGQTVISGKLNLDETIVNLETLQSGIYLLSIDGINKQSIKVIKE